LLWWSLIVSILVCLIVAILVLWGVVRRRVSSDAGEVAAVAIVPGEGGARWIWIGVAVSTLPLLVTLVWTVAVLAHVGPVPRHPALTIDVEARQYWWDAAYSGNTPDLAFHTANEIHVPVGMPILLRLSSSDVIHSFWVPRLAGKMDVIPGQTNLVWLQAERPGRYRGQCAEFCGFQHAHMAFEVVAEPLDSFMAWWRGQLRPAPPPVGPAASRGLALVEYRCGLCHRIRGTGAGSGAGPDLTHLMSRATIAAGTLPNNEGSLAGWIENPQGVKPGALMPDQALSGPQLADLRAYLATLK
jgi:cytochrome c oxidase subunit 2